MDTSDLKADMWYCMEKNKKNLNSIGQKCFQKSCLWMQVIVPSTLNECVKVIQKQAHIKRTEEKWKPVLWSDKSKLDA